MPGTLYVVATPIGNLEDITLRALRILKEVDLVAAEDTRLTRRLLTHFEIHVPTVSFHQHSDRSKIDDLINRLNEGINIALVTDSGTPGISDPGGLLVEAAHSAKILVIPIPGPSALATAISAAGMRAQRFHFLGFAPRKAGERLRLLESYREDEETLVLYESPYRLVSTLETALKALGDRKVVVCRELTKKFEELVVSPLSEAIAHFKKKDPKGEIVIVIEGQFKTNSSI
jgi:16S rRNA (cytidine1402-2'-O)-methyltransferase